MAQRMQTDLEMTMRAAFETVIRDILTQMTAELLSIAADPLSSHGNDYRQGFIAACDRIALTLLRLRENRAESLLTAVERGEAPLRGRVLRVLAAYYATTTDGLPAYMERWAGQMAHRSLTTSTCVCPHPHRECLTCGCGLLTRNANRCLPRR